MNRREQAHGRPLEVVVREAEDMEFLLDAVDTGYVPEFEGIKMALDGHSLFAEAQARAEAAAGRAGFAHMWLYDTANEYRVVAARLLAEAERLEALGPGLDAAAAAAG